MKNLVSIFFLIAIISACTTPGQNEDSAEASENKIDSISYEGLKLDELSLPDGFEIDVYARVNNARSMAMSPSGTLFVGNRGGDKVYAVKDTDGDFKADYLYVLDTGLRMPNGVAFKDGDLYVAEVSKLWVYEDIENNLEAPTKKLIYDDYPEDAHHGWKYIAFGPDGKLYIPVGAPCNICESQNEIYATITRMNPDGSDREIYAKGVRNSVGFTWHPESGDMYFTDNGRDMLGDTIPSCELNHITEAGQHFGYPYWHAGDVKDPEFGDKYPQDDFVAPAQKLGPHVAPLGVKFYTGDMFPASYQGMAFVALHGSWNRSPEAGHTGHKVSLVRIEDGSGVEQKPFIEGFLNQETNRAWGRPVDVLFMEDGSMLLSDDLTGTIYRVSYKG